MHNNILLVFLTIISIVLVYFLIWPLILYIMRPIKKYFESFDNEYYPVYYYTYPPYWGYQTGTTRNMSYDLRGDIPIPYHQVSPWNQPTSFPIQNKPLYLVS